MNNGDLRPERQNLLSYLNLLNNAQFVIPVFQRNYVWQSDKQVKKFIDDYDRVLKRASETHFIGIIMFLVIPKSTSLFEYSIIDGQQRIITIFLLLQALKEIALDNGDKDFANLISSKYLTNPNIINAEEKLKLKPLVTDDEVYKKIILEKKESLTESDKKTNLYKNYVYIKKRLNELYGNYPLETMLLALDKFNFVVIPLGRNDDAQEIFETINSTGAELSNSDLIRNFILMNIDSTQQEDLYLNYWRPMEKRFENSGKIESFFRMFLACKTKVLNNERDTYDIFRDWFNNEKIENGRSVRNILNEIRRYAGYYYDVYISSTTAFPSPIKESLMEFKKSTIEPTAPLIIEICNLFKTYDSMTNKPLVSAENFAKIVDLLNTYNIRRNLCNLRTGVLTRIIPPMLRDILEECNGDYGNIYDICVRYLVDNNKGKASMMPDDADMRIILRDANMYSLKTYLKLAFEKIESHIWENEKPVRKNPARLDFSNLSIEHLMPQTITPEWYNILKITEDEYEHQLNRLGNLTLATSSDNSKMSNNPFEYKKQVLSESGHIKLNEEILDNDSWTLDNINNRTNQLIERICCMYPYITVGTNFEQKKFIIDYKSYQCHIRAYLYADLTVEIQGDSFFVKDDYNLPEIQDLIDNDMIISKDNGYIFKEPFTFENLEKAHKILTNMEIDCWEAWVDQDDLPLNFSVKPQVLKANIGVKRS